MSTSPKKQWLIAEYNPHHIYMGWHLYLRDSSDYQTRNADGSWGWLRRPKEGMAQELLTDFGCAITGDGTCDHDGIARFAKRFPLPGRKCGRKTRGGLLVTISEVAPRVMRPAA